MLKLYYINHFFNFEVFDILCIALIIKNKKRLFLKQKAIYLPITKNILKKITDNKLINFDKLNINIVFKVV